MGNRSFLARLRFSMIASLALNALIGHYLKSSLSKGTFSVAIDATYQVSSTMELMYDAGKDFDQGQRVQRTFKKGRNIVSFPFELKETERLRYLRLDFGTNTNLNKVELNSVTLSSKGKQLFGLKKNGISKKVGLKTGISEFETTTATFILDLNRKPFDPYIVFDAVNELIFPQWQRMLALVLPWLVFLCLPLLKWFECVYREREYALILSGLFCCMIPLKIAWVTFATLLLMAYALFNYYQKRRIKFERVYISLLIFFLVPLLFLGNGEVSQLSIPLGFVLFIIIGSLINFSDRTDRIKKIYITVFLVVASITLVSWLLLMAFYGYNYKIDFSGYFMNIKIHAYATMFWLYYSHTTFLSFFIIVGGIFLLDFYDKKKLSSKYVLFYGVLGFGSLVILGSRFAMLMGLVLPFLTRVSVKNLSRWLIPAWLTIFSLLVYFVRYLDVRRNQLWKISWEAFKERPWLGHGTGTSESVLNDMERIRRAGFETSVDMNHPHNQFLTYLLENGLLGTLLFLVAFLYIVYRFAEQRNKSMLLISFMVLMLMIVESPFRTTIPLYVIAFLFSIFTYRESPLTTHPNR